MCKPEKCKKSQKFVKIIYNKLFFIPKRNWSIKSCKYSGTNQKKIFNSVMDLMCREYWRYSRIRFRKIINNTVHRGVIKKVI